MCGIRFPISEVETPHFRDSSVEISSAFTPEIAEGRNWVSKNINCGWIRGLRPRGRCASYEVPKVLAAGSRAGRQGARSTWDAHRIIIISVVRVQRLL